MNYFRFMLFNRRGLCRFKNPIGATIFSLKGDQNRNIYRERGLIHRKLGQNKPRG